MHSLSKKVVSGEEFGCKGFNVPGVLMKRGCEYTRKGTKCMDLAEKKATRVGFR